MTFHILCDYPDCTKDVGEQPHYTVTIEQPEEYKDGENVVDETLVYCEEHIRFFEPVLPRHLEYIDPEEAAEA